MHSAPPVLVSVGRFIWAGRIAALLALLSLCLGCVWGQVQPIPIVWRAALLPAWLVLALLSVGCWRNEVLPAGQLAWDGQVWRFQDGHPGGDALEVRVRLVWDGQSVLLLHVQTVVADRRQGPAGFACLRAADHPGHWHGVRCAVHATNNL